MGASAGFPELVRLSGPALFSLFPSQFPLYGYAICLYSLGRPQSGIKSKTYIPFPTQEPIFALSEQYHPCRRCTPRPTRQPSFMEFCHVLELLPGERAQDAEVLEQDTFSQPTPSRADRFLVLCKHLSHTFKPLPFVLQIISFFFFFLQCPLTNN